MGTVRRFEPNPIEIRTLGGSLLKLGSWRATTDSSPSSWRTQRDARVAEQQAAAAAAAAEDAILHPDPVAPSVTDASTTEAPLTDQNTTLAATTTTATAAADTNDAQTDATNPASIIAPSQAKAKLAS